MPMHVKDGGVWKTGDPFVKQGGVWKAVTNGFVKTGGVWEQFYTQSGPPPAALSATVAPTTASGVSETTTTFTNTVTVTPSGGTPGYTYLWRRIAGNVNIAITNHLAATTAFTHAGLLPVTAEFVCDVSDAATGMVTTETVFVDFS